MKRLTSLVVLGTAALLISPSLYAQRGMSGRGGGGGSSFKVAASDLLRLAGSGQQALREFVPLPADSDRLPAFATFGPVARPGGFSCFAPSNRAFSSRTFVSEPARLCKPSFRISTAFIIASASLMAALDVLRHFSLAADFSWDHLSFLTLPASMATTTEMVTAAMARPRRSPWL